MTKWFTPLLTVVVLALAGYAGFLSVENQRLRSRLEATLAQSEADPSPETRRSDFEEPVEKPARDGSSGPSEAVGTAEPSYAEVMEQRRQERSERMQRFLEQFDNPEMRMDMIERSMIQIDERYAAFFATLGLPAEDIDALKTLMAERNVLRREAQMKSFAADGEEQRESVREEMRERREGLAADIEGLLGEEAAGDLQRYTESLPHRAKVEEFAQSLSYSDTPLDDRQTEQLVSAYSEISQDFQYTFDLENLDRGDRRNLDREKIETYFEERANFDTLVLSEAEKSLSEAQLISLASKQQADRERELRQASFALENFGGDRGGDRGGPRRGGSR